MNGKKVSGLIFAVVSILVANVDYNSEVQPLLNDNCSGCHIGSSSGGLSLGSYSDLMTTGNNGPVVIAGDHLNSILYQKISGTQTFGSPMPPYGSGMSNDDIDLIAAWIDEGALENASTPTSTVFMTELTDPQNSADAGRYVELYNNGSSEVNLGDGWALQRWTNGNSDPQSPELLTGTIAAGGFYIICNDEDEFSATYGFSCDQDIGTGGPADSNGDDNIALLDPTGAIVDMFGVAGEDGTGTGHEFEDGRAERAEGVTQGNPVWDESEWNIDNDSGGGDGNQYAPEGFDPFAWIGSGEVVTPDPDVFIVGDMNDWTPGSDGWGMISENGVGVLGATMTAGTYGYKAVEGSSWDDANYPGNNQSVNLSEDGDVTFYVNVDYDLVFHTNPSVVGGFFNSMDGSTDWDPANTSGEMLPTENELEWGWSGVIPAGSHEFKVALNQNWDQSTGDNISINSDGASTTNIFYNFSTNETSYETTAPTFAVTFNVNMNYQDVDAENGVRLFGLGSWSSDDATTMTDDDGDGIYSATVSLISGSYEFKYRNGWDYEDVDELDCAVLTGDYWNRSLTVSGADASLDVSCFGACADCVPGCMDPNAENYNPDANTSSDEHECTYPPVEPDNIFYSEYGEGSSYNKYLEVFNASDEEVDLSGYQRVNCSNGCDEWEYYSDFAEGAVIAPGDVYVICDSGVGEDFPSGECDESGALYFNGDDAQGLFHTASATTIDVIGAIGDDPGSGWEVAGVADGTKDHSIVRDASVTTGNADWTSSAGTSADDSEWLVFDQNTWAYIGSHPHDFATLCDDDTACNFGAEGDCEYAPEGFDCDGNALVDVTFQVNMSEQVVDTEGYGLDLNLAGGWYDMTDDDGDDIWSVTVTLIEFTEYTYKFKNGDAWEVNFNDLGCGAGDTYGNRIFTTGDSDMTLGPFCFNSCTDCEEEVACGTGDVNFDGEINVTDIVNIVNHVLLINLMDDDGFCAADMNTDDLVNVTDIVIIVNIILDGRLVYADSATIMKTKIGLLLDSDSQVGAVQISLKHDKNFSYILNEQALLAKAVTQGNITTFISIVPENGIIITTSDDYEIIDVIAANDQGEIDVNVVTEFNLLTNYPNPFNPATIISYVVEFDSHIKLDVFNLNGRLVNSLVNDFYTSGSYTSSWDGTDANGNHVGSGLYLLVYESNGEISSRKITLMR